MGFQIRRFITYYCGIAKIVIKSDSMVIKLFREKSEEVRDKRFGFS